MTSQFLSATQATTPAPNSRPVCSDVHPTHVLMRHPRCKISKSELRVCPSILFPAPTWWPQKDRGTDVGCDVPQLPEGFSPRPTGKRKPTVGRVSPRMPAATKLGEKAGGACSRSRATKSQDVNSGGPARPGSSAERLLPPENGRRLPQCRMPWQYVLTPNARRDTVARCGEAQRTEGGPDAPARRPHNQTPGAAGGETLRVRSSGSASFKSALQ